MDEQDFPSRSMRKATHTWNFTLTLTLSLKGEGITERPCRKRRAELTAGRVTL